MEYSMKTPRWKVALWGTVLMAAMQPGDGFAKSEIPVVGSAQAPAKVAYQSRTFNVPGANYAIPLKINDEYDVVGYAGFSTDTQGFLYNLKSGGLEEIAAPGACATFPTGVNNESQVVGTYYSGFCEEPGAEPHAFLMDADGTFYTIDISTGSFTDPAGINDKGKVVGVRHC
jgi:hypothetical protein